MEHAFLALGGEWERVVVDMEIPKDISFAIHQILEHRCHNMCAKVVNEFRLQKIFAFALLRDTQRSRYLCVIEGNT